MAALVNDFFAAVALFVKQEQKGGPARYGYIHWKLPLGPRSLAVNTSAPVLFSSFDDLLACLHKRGSAIGTKDVMLFVHGFNEDFMSSSVSAVQAYNNIFMNHATDGEQGKAPVLVFFNWPSVAGAAKKWLTSAGAALLRYKSDRKAVEGRTKHGSYIYDQLRAVIEGIAGGTDTQQQQVSLLDKCHTWPVCSPWNKAVDRL